MNDKPMPMKEIRIYLTKQGLRIDRNWVNDLCVVYDSNGVQVAQGPRAEIADRVRAGEQF